MFSVKPGQLGRLARHLGKTSRPLLCTRLVGNVRSGSWSALAVDEVRDTMLEWGQGALKFKTGPSQVAISTCPFCRANIPHNHAGKADASLAEGASATPTDLAASSEDKTLPYFFYINSMYGIYDCKKCGAYGEWPDLKTAMALPAGKTAITKRLDIAKLTDFNRDFQRLVATNAEVPMPKAIKPYGLLDKTFATYRSFFTAPTTEGATDSVLVLPYWDTYRLKDDEEKKDPVVVAYNRCKLYDVNQFFESNRHLSVSRKLRPDGQNIANLAGVAVESVGRAGLFGYNVLVDHLAKMALPNAVQGNNNLTSDTVVVASDELSAMAIYQATNIPAVCCSSNQGGITPDVLSLLEPFDRVVFWPDHRVDKNETNKFASKLGRHRVFTVESSSHSNALAAVLHSADVSGMIDAAKPMPTSQLIRVAEMADDIYSETQTDGKTLGASSRVLPTLTKVIKGLRRGEMTVLTGPTGSGKTSLLSAMSLDYCMNAGMRTLWGSFEIPNARLAKKMLSQFHNQSVNNLNRDEFNGLVQRFEQLPLWFMRYFGGSDMDEVLKTMEFAVYESNVDHVIVDNLQFMLSSISEDRQFARLDRYERQDIAISRFRRFATLHNVHVTLVIHPRKENDDAMLQMASIGGTPKASQEADNVVVLQRKGDWRMLEVMKNRYDGVLGRIPYYYDNDTSRLYDLLDGEFFVGQFNQRIREWQKTEKFYELIGVTEEEDRQREIEDEMEEMNRSMASGGRSFGVSYGFSSANRPNRGQAQAQAQAQWSPNANSNGGNGPPKNINNGGNGYNNGGPNFQQRNNSNGGNGNGFQRNNNNGGNGNGFNSGAQWSGNNNSGANFQQRNNSNGGNGNGFQRNNNFNRG